MGIPMNIGFGHLPLGNGHLRVLSVSGLLRQGPVDGTQRMIIFKNDGKPAVQHVSG